LENQRVKDTQFDEWYVPFTSSTSTVVDHWAIKNAIAKVGSFEKTNLPKRWL